MKELKTWRDVIKAILDGECVQYMYGDQYMNRVEFPPISINILDDEPIRKHRIKPRAMMIGDMEVPEPVIDVSELEEEEAYCLPNLYRMRLYDVYTWDGGDLDLRLLKRGLIHKTKEAAIAHAKALIALTSVE